nr:hypothetical protein [Candidatus Gracilibacteria bacterium]
YKPIITFTTSEKVRNQLALVWGLNNIFVQKIDFKNAAKEIAKFLKKEGIVKKGEEIVIVINASKDENLISTTVV